MAQLLMQHTELGHQNPLDMVYHVQPWMILSVLPFAAFFEGKLFVDGVAFASNLSSNHSA